MNQKEISPDDVMIKTKHGKVIPLGFFTRYSYANYICKECIRQPCLVLRSDNYVPHGCLFPNKNMQQTPKWMLLKDD